MAGSQSLPWCRRNASRAGSRPAGVPTTQDSMLSLAARSPRGRSHTRFDHCGPYPARRTSSKINRASCWRRRMLSLCPVRKVIAPSPSDQFEYLQWPLATTHAPGNHRYRDRLPYGSLPAVAGRGLAFVARCKVLSAKLTTRYSRPITPTAITEKAHYEGKYSIRR